jgi:hypothetical protein
MTAWRASGCEETTDLKNYDKEGIQMTGKEAGLHEHEWVVFSTTLAECRLMVQCVECGAMGTVDDPSKEEWAEAFNAPSRPYRWQDDSRVTVRHKECRQFYVARWKPGPICGCPVNDTEAPQPDYERVPAEITRRSRPLTQGEKWELEEFASTASERDDQCSALFPLGVKSFQEHTGQECTSALRKIADCIESLHRKGMHLRPTMVARVRREFAKEQ